MARSYDQENPPYPADLYRDIEDWWGADFDDKLIKRMVNAPYKHQRAFARQLLPLRLYMTREPPEIARGVMRPAVARQAFESVSQRQIAALRLLLYAQEVVLDNGDFFPADFEPSYDRKPAKYEVALKQLARIRPLVEDGSVKFAPLDSMGAHPSLANAVEGLMKWPDISYALQTTLNYVNSEGIGSEVDDATKLNDLLWFACGSISAACNLAERRIAHTLARNPMDQIVIRALLQRPMTDGRQIVLQKLASLRVPTMTGDIGTLIKIRKSNADFADWRIRLSEAMSYVGELSEDERSLYEAAEVVYATLSDGLSQVRKATNKSPALQAVKGGATGLVISGISAITTGVLSGNPWVSLASGAAGKFADSVFTYVKALQARRKGRLILDVSMLFDPHSSDKD